MAERIEVMKDGFRVPAQSVEDIVLYEVETGKEVRYTHSVDAREALKSEKYTLEKPGGKKGEVSSYVRDMRTTQSEAPKVANQPEVSVGNTSAPEFTSEAQMRQAKEAEVPEEKAAKVVAKDQAAAPAAQVVPAAHTVGRKQP